MGDVFNKIQKKYLNIPSGAANAAPEKGPRFNAIQKKYLSARPAAGAKAGEDDRAPSMAELRGQLSALPAAEPRRKDKKSAPALPATTESAGTSAEPTPLPRWEGAAPWDAPVPAAGALYTDFLNAEETESAPAFRRRDRLEDDGLFDLLSGENAGGYRPLFGGDEGRPARLWSGGERLRADRPEPDREPGPVRAVRGRTALPELRESGYRPAPLSAAEPTPLPAPTPKPELPNSPAVPQPEADIRFFRNGDQTVWADMSTLQGIGVLPDGTYINTTGDEYADILYEIIRAEHDGEISAEEAHKRKKNLAKTIADRKYPDDPEKREEYYHDRLSVFASRNIHYYDIPDITEWLDYQMLEAEYEVPELISQPYWMALSVPIDKTFFDDPRDYQRVQEGINEQPEQNNQNHTHVGQTAGTVEQPVDHRIKGNDEITKE